MDSLVLELQQDATNEETAITELLRKARLVSRKLGADGLRDWIEAELNGYSPDEDLPEYRVVPAKLNAETPHGRQPVIVENPDLKDIVSKAYVRQSSGEVENLVYDNDESLVRLSVPQEAQNTLHKAMAVSHPLFLLTPKSSFKAILDTIRNRVQEWTIELEDDGIIGEGKTFSDDEKNVAKHKEYGTYNDVDVNVDRMIGSHIQQSGSKSSFQNETDVDLDNDLSELISEIKDVIDNLDLSDDQFEVVKSDIRTLESQLNSPKPKSGVITSSLNSLRSILEGTLASGLAEQIPALVAAAEGSTM